MPNPSSRVGISPALTDGIRVMLEKRKGPQYLHPGNSLVLNKDSPGSMLLGPARFYICSEVGCAGKRKAVLALENPGTDSKSKSWYVPW